MDNSENKKEEGLRFNEGKVRHDLLEPFAINELAKVFTKGAEKYSENNWLNGMSWTKVLASLKRHLNEFEQGKDFDDETELLHMAHVAWNAMALVSYYKYAPKYDDRFVNTKPKLKIGLDLDEILISWIDGYKEKYGYSDEHEFNSWYLHYDILKRCKDEMDSTFYLNLKPKISPKDIPFEPHAYITSRNIDSKITQEWLYRNGFPCVPVYTVGLTESKSDVAKKIGIDLFVDDVYKNFIELNQAGVCCYLLDAPHNRRFNVGHKRIYSLKELPV